MPGAPASAPRDTHRSAEAADCSCSSGHSGKSAAATPPVRSYSWHARRRLAARGLCLNCGQVPPADGAKYCSGCIERRRASDRKAARKRRLLRRNQSLCAECGAAAEKPRQRLCEACNEKHRALSRRRQQDRKEERKQAGLCVQCGGRAPAEGNASCDDCLARRRLAYRVRIDRRRRQGDRSLCIECGKAPPAPGRRRCPDCQPLTARRDKDAARHRREARRAVGLCTVCGQHSAVRGRTACEACLAGWLAQYNRKALARVAQGLCIRCGKEPPATGFASCEPCRDSHRAASLAKWRRRAAERRAMQRCIRCGEDLADGEQEVCEPCRDTQRRSARRRADRRKALGVCVRCGRRPAERGTRDCGPCRDRQRAYGYRGMPDLPPRYTVIEIATGTDHGTWDTVQEVAGALAYYRRTSSERKALGLCVRCGRRPPERGTLDCGPCGDKQRAREYRGMPDLPDRYTVIEIATGTDHGTWDNLQEVAGALAYAKLTLDDVEIVTDAAPMAAFRSW